MTVNIDIMRGRLDEIESEFRALDTAAGEARLDEAQQARWDELDTEAAAIRQNIADAEAAEARAARVAEARARWGSVQVAQPRRDAFDLSDMRSLSGAELVDRARSAFDPAFSRRGASDAAQEVLRKLDVFADRGDDLANRPFVLLFAGKSAVQIDHMQTARPLLKPMRSLFAGRIGKNRRIVHEPLFETDALPVLQVNRGNDQHFGKRK